LRTLKTSELNDFRAEAKQGTADLELVAIVLATLPHRLQTVISLHYLEGMKVADIYRVTTRSEGTVKSRLHEARALMRERLEKRGFTNGR
jgi:DNA-directed RNA polymerase specialized sigma24 family protein